METKFLTEKDYELWDKFCDENLYSTFLHTTHAMKYYIDSSFNIRAEQKSFFLYNNNEVIACMPLFLENISEKNYLSFGGAPLLNPLISNNLNDRSRKKVFKYVMKQIDELAYKYNVKHLKMSEAYLNSNYLKKQDKYNFYLKYNGFNDISSSTCIVPLESEEKVFSGFSREFKLHVRKSEKYLKSIIIDKNNVTKEEVLDKFSNYYFQIANKVTRPMNTFNNIYEWIKKGFAILIRAELDKKTVGYSLFYIYKDTAYYAMGCKDKEYEHFQISHFIQWECFKYLIKNNIYYHEMGNQDFQDSIYNLADKKDITISRFKRGFGGFIIPVFKGEKFYDKEEFIKCYEERIYKYAERNFSNKNLE